MVSSAAIKGRSAASGADDGTRRPFYQRLYLQVLVAMLGGGALGSFYPDVAASLKPLSDGFIKAVRALIQPIIFATVVVGIATMGNLRQIAKIGVRALIYFEVVSSLALLIGVAVGNLYHFRAGINADPASLNTKLVAGYVENAKSLTLVDFLLNIVPDSFIGAFTRGDILPALLLAVLSGLPLCQLGERANPLINVLAIAVHGLFGVVRIIMYFAPLAALGAIAFTIGKYGVGTLLQLGQLVAGVYIVSILFVII